jgi:ubiquinol-cytochrome c reductase cytochrome c1 subunit
MRLALACALLAATLAGPALADVTLQPLAQTQGIFASTDKAAAQRGFLVYQSVCAACHAMGALHYRDLEALGFTPDEVAGIASSIKMPDGSPATLDDLFKTPNASAAAFGGAVPPDLSSIVAERPKGVWYVYRLLTGYTDAPADVTLLPSHYYNPAYPGSQIAMPPPLRDNAVTYADGTPATAQQEAADVATFLAWSADPNLDAHHETGLRAVLFLIFLTIIAIATKRKIWRETH